MNQMASSAGPQTTIPPDAEPNSSSIAAGEILYHALQQLHRDHPARQRIEGAQRTALTNLESSVEQLKNFSVASDALFQSCSASFPNHLHFLSQIKKDLNHLEAKVTWLKMRACRIAEHDGVDLSFLDGEPTTTAATTTTTATSANVTNNNNNNVINPTDDEVLSMQQEEEGRTAALPVTPLPNQDVSIISAPHSNAASSVDASEGQKGEEEEVDLPAQQQDEAEAAAADDGEEEEEGEKAQEGGVGVVEDDETALETMDEAVAKSADEATD